MELWVAGFNAWGQLNLCEDNQKTNSSFPDDIYMFQSRIKADDISVLWTGISANLSSPDEFIKTLSHDSSLCSNIALAGNGKLAAIENGTLKLYDSLQNYKNGEGNFAEVHQKITCIVANQTSFTALSSSGDVLTWGDVRYHTCLGRDFQNERSATLPGLVENICDLPTGPIKKISSGGYVTAVLTRGNDLYIWGGRPDQPKIFSDLTCNPLPVDIEGADIKDVAVGFDHILALTLEGKLYTVGFGGSGQLGFTLKRVHQWKEIKLFPEEHQKVIKIFAGYKTSFVVTE